MQPPTKHCLKWDHIYSPKTPANTSVDDQFFTKTINKSCILFPLSFTLNGISAPFLPTAIIIISLFYSRAPKKGRSAPRCTPVQMHGAGTSKLHFYGLPQRQIFNLNFMLLRREQQTIVFTVHRSNFNNMLMVCETLP